MTGRTGPSFGTPPGEGTSAPRPETTRERLSYAGYAAMERLAMALPERVGRAVFDLGALAAFRLFARSRRIVQRNLARVLGEAPGSPLLDAAVREAFRSYARYWHETFQVRALAPEELRKRFRMEGLEHIDAALEAGRGAVIALPHLGNWDVAGYWMHLHGYRVVAVAEELRPKALYELFLRHRMALGLEIVPLADRRTVREELRRRLAGNRIVALVADRALRGRGVDVEMFGATRRMPPGPATLSLASECPLIPCAVYFVDGQWRAVIGPRLEAERSGDLREDAAALTRLLAVEFERIIAAAPTQWHMFQPAWPDGERGVQLAEAPRRRRSAEEGNRGE